MADASGDAAGEAQVTFKVKTSGDKSHTITMAESATVLDLKTKLAGEDYENVPVDRQRLIYSGRVMKNDDSLGTYKIKAGNTIHMVKSAASNPAPASSATSASSSPPPAVPSNMAAGTAANNLLAGLTGARFAGHANLPSRDLFGADGGMGAPPNEDQMADMLSNPAVAQSMAEALNNPAFLDYMIQSNPMLANMPNAREMLQSPGFRSMMMNPESLRMAARLRRMMAGGGQGAGAFPAPGATDTTPADAPASDSTNNSNSNAAQNQNPFGGFPLMFGMPGAGLGATPGGNAGVNPMLALLNNMGANPTDPSRTARNTPTAAATGAQAAAATPGAGAAATPAAAPQPGSPSTATPQSGSPAPPPAANPFAALFGGMDPAAAQGMGGAANPYGLPPMSPEALQQAWQLMGMGPGVPAAAAADTRPPEERYAEQLRQLNDMGFYDFDRNVAALRRSGGNVQGAVEYLLSG